MIFRLQAGRPLTVPWPSRERKAGPVVAGAGLAAAGRAVAGRAVAGRAVAGRAAGGGAGGGGGRAGEATWARAVPVRYRRIIRPARLAGWAGPGRAGLDP